MRARQRISEYLKDFIFKLKSWQIILLLTLLIVGFILLISIAFLKFFKYISSILLLFIFPILTFFLIKVMPFRKYGVKGTYFFAVGLFALLIYILFHVFDSKIYAYILLILALLLVRLVPLHKYGFRASYFFLFVITIILGPVKALLFLAPASMVALLFKRRPELVALKTLDYIILVIIVALISFFYGITYIIQNFGIVFVYVFLLWTVILFAKLLVMGRNIVHKQSATVIVEFMINYWLLITFGEQFINYLLTL